MLSPSISHRRSTLLFLFKVARPGFWSTSIWFYMLPLEQRLVFGSAAFWIGLLFVTLPLGLILYGANDLADVETDRLNPRKGNFLFGARGTSDQLASLPRQIALVQVPFIAAFALLIGPQLTAGWFAAALAFTAVYNLPKLGTKNWPFLDLLSQTGYLLVFVLSSALNGVPHLPWYTQLFGALFAMHSHLFGQIMDHAPDQLAGRRTTAVVIGILPAKTLIIGLLAVESWLVLVYAGSWLLSSFLAAAAFWFVLDLTMLWRYRSYSPFQMRCFLLGWNAAAILSLPLVWKWGRLSG